MTEVKNGMQERCSISKAADALIRKSLTWIKQQCVGGKGVSNEKLDAHQMASFDLAWCAAESTAARFAAEYAGKVAAAADGRWYCLEERMARVFVPKPCRTSTIVSAGATAELRSERRRPGGLASAKPLSRFCQTQLDAGNLEALGRQVIALNGASGAYLLE
jgi:(2S)-methylsuccinyl-CoA dehydrogenase